MAALRSAAGDSGAAGGAGGAAAGAGAGAAAGGGGAVRSAPPGGRRRQPRRPGAGCARPGPIPRSASTSMPSSCASCRADGEIRRRCSAGTPGAGAEGAAGGGAGAAAAGAGATGAGAAGAGAGVAPSSRMTASGVPTGTSVPGSISICSITPVVKTSTSTSALSVWTTAMMSPRLTASPGCFSQAASVPALMSAPSEGMTKSAIRTPSPAPRRRRARRSAAPPPRDAWRRASAPRRRTPAAPASRAGRSPVP